MHTQRGFIMGVVLISILALSLAGATAVLLSSTDIDMAGALRQKQQLEYCAGAGVDITATNLPYPNNASNAWAVDSQRLAIDQQFVAKPEHLTTATYSGSGTFTPVRATLPDDATRAMMQNQTRGAGVGNRGRIQASNPPSFIASQSIQIFRLVSTCTQKSNGGKLEAEGVYVYNPQ